MNKEAFRTAFIYAIFGIIWIITSDRILHIFIADNDILLTLQTYKGITFVVVTTLLIYFLVIREIKTKNNLISVLNTESNWHNQLISNIPDIDVYLINDQNEIVLSQGKNNHKNGTKLNLSDTSNPFLNQIKPHLDTILYGGNIVSEWKNNDQWYELRGEAVFDNKNSVTSALFVIINITNQKQIQADLELSKTHAEQNDKLKSAFLANMSHEIRTPLNGILGFSNLICTDSLSADDKAKFSSIINNSGNQLLRMIDDILDISKLETGQLRVHNTETNVTNLIKEVAVLLESRILNNKKAVNVIVNCDVLETTTVFCDKGRLTQILTNLTNNAEKFTFEGSISIACKTSENELLFEVEDTGNGITPQAIEKIFNRFIQADNTIHSGYGGFGLGLAICQELLHIMGGKIWVESQIDKGSKFSFTLPLVTTIKNSQLSINKSQELKYTEG